tara:strand:+ start:39745 stop:40650 length:906 start_codon:yes stop_codon:yes gene_type:complete
MDVPFLYRQLSYVALNVSDLSRSTSFYSDLLGLELSAEQVGESSALRCDTHAASLLLYQADEPGLRRVAFQLASSADLAAAATHFEARGYEIWPIPREELPFLRVAGGFRLYEPTTRVTFEYFASVMDLGKPYQPTVANIQRLGHVVLRVVDLDGCWEVLERDFGLLSSDFVEDKAVWARCYPNPFHHSLALVKSPENGLHHVNFMVSEIDDIGRARNRLMDAGVDIVFGPGRHKPSGSVFLYFLDPDGMTAEFSFGMEEFPAENAREPRMLENSSTTMDLWGGKPKPTFSSAGVIAGKDR